MREHLIQEIREAGGKFLILHDETNGGFEELDLEGHFKTGGGMLSLTSKNPLYKANEKDPDMNT